VITTRSGACASRLKLPNSSRGTARMSQPGKSPSPPSKRVPAGSGTRTVRRSPPATRTSSAVSPLTRTSTDDRILPMRDVSLIETTRPARSSRVTLRSVIRQIGLLSSSRSRTSLTSITCRPSGVSTISREE
jgi:hypothetical protein